MKNFCLFLSLFLMQFACSNNSSHEKRTNGPFANEIQKAYLSSFLTGPQYCEKFKEITANERGFKVSVPVDYSSPSSGTTEIHAFWAEGFYDPNLPTVMFFDGGPGGNSHGMKRISKSFNQLHFDQRGIGCSSPSTLELYRNAKFYSSLNNAMDAEMIRKHLKIDKISLYGGSYGTVPATIYAHRYPKSTTAVVLEGVLYSGATDESSRFLNFYLKSVYKKLPETTKEAMKVYFNTEELATAVAAFAQLLMYNNDGVQELDRYLRAIFPDKEHINRDIAGQIFTTDLAKSFFFDKESIDSVDIINLISFTCRERRVKNSTSSRFIFNDKTKEEFKLTTTVAEDDEVCAALGFSADAIPYSANNYPIRVPVTYFQGTWDGATFPEGAILHFKRVAKGTTQLLVAKKGGHSPNLSAIMFEGDESGEMGPNEVGRASIVRQQHIVITDKALRGQLITEEDVQKLNRLSDRIEWLRILKK